MFYDIAMNALKTLLETDELDNLLPGCTQFNAILDEGTRLKVYYPYLFQAIAERGVVDQDLTLSLALQAIAKYKENLGSQEDWLQIINKPSKITKQSDFNYDFSDDQEDEEMED